MKAVTTSVRLTPQEREALEQLRRQRGSRSWGEVLRELLAEAVAEELGKEVEGEG